MSPTGPACPRNTLRAGLPRSHSTLGLALPPRCCACKARWTRSGSARRRHGGLHRHDGLPVDVGAPFSCLDEQRTESTLPHVAQDAVGRERQVGLETDFSVSEVFARKDCVHGVPDPQAAVSTRLRRWVEVGVQSQDQMRRIQAGVRSGFGR